MSCRAWSTWLHGTPAFGTFPPWCHAPNYTIFGQRQAVSAKTDTETSPLSLWTSARRSSGKSREFYSELPFLPSFTAFDKMDNNFSSEGKKKIYIYGVFRNYFYIAKILMEQNELQFKGGSELPYSFKDMSILLVIKSPSEKQVGLSESLCLLNLVLFLNPNKEPRHDECSLNPESLWLLSKELLNIKSLQL